MTSASDALFVDRKDASAKLAFGSTKDVDGCGNAVRAVYEFVLGGCGNARLWL